MGRDSLKLEEQFKFQIGHAFRKSWEPAWQPPKSCRARLQPCCEPRGVRAASARRPVRNWVAAQIREDTDRGTQVTDVCRYLQQAFWSVVL